MVVSALLLLSLGLLTAQAQNCSKPDGGPNMHLRDDAILSKTFPDGDKVSFACDVGYMPVGGSAVITCTAGSWSPVRLRCDLKNCGPIGEVANGLIDYPTGTEFGAKAVITCNEGFEMIGSKEITCGDQGWLDRLPVCEVIKCDPPAAVVDGKFSPSQESYEYREVVQYSCKNDLTLNGSKILSCSEDGRFKPSPPKCIRVECGEPKIDFGKFKDGARPPYRYKAAVTLQCNIGYKMDGKPDQICELNSQWSPGLPQCTPVECKDPKIENGDQKEGFQPPYRYSSKVMLECNTGYVMKGAPTQTCDTTGQWSPGLPECELVECKNPKIENGDQKEGSQPPYRYSSKVTLQCVSGYTMTGESNQTCDANGHWTPGLPECKLVECKDPKIKNGKEEDSKPPYRYSSTVTLQCNTGYTMTGESTQTCGANGQWSPGLPECKFGDSPDDGGGNIGRNVGIAVAVVGAIFIIGFAFIWRRKRSRRDITDKEATKEGEEVALA